MPRGIPIEWLYHFRAQESLTLETRESLTLKGSRTCQSKVHKVCRNCVSKRNVTLKKLDCASLSVCRASPPQHNRLASFVLGMFHSEPSRLFSECLF